MIRRLALAALLLAAPARADVTLSQRLSITSVAGTGSGTVVTATSGKYRREERRLALDGPFAGAQPDTSEVAIMRLDRGVIDRLSDADSTYEEIPFARALSHLPQAPMPGVDPNGLDIAWTVEASSPGGSETIAGHVATPHTLTLRGKGTQKGTGQPVELVLGFTLWTAPGVPGAAEMRAFDAGYAAGVGMAPGMIEETLGSYGVPRATIRRLTDARARIAGTPLRTVMTVAMPSLGDLLSKLSATLGANAPAPDGPLLTSTLEVESIDTSKIAPARFRVPAGYRRR